MKYIQINFEDDKDIPYDIQNKFIRRKNLYGKYT